MGSGHIGHDEAHLIHVRREHHALGVLALGPGLYNHHVAQAVQLGFQPHALDFRQQSPAQGLLIAAGGTQFRQRFQIHRSSSHPASSSLRKWDSKRLPSFSA